MKIFPIILTFVVSLMYLNVSASEIVAPSNSELKAAQNELDNSIQNLEDIKEKKELTPEEKERLELEASKKALADVVQFSIAETSNIIGKLNQLTDLEEKYAESRDGHLAILEELLNFQEDYLLNLEDENLDLAGVKKLATAFKKWRADVYDPALRDAINFLLVLQGNEVLAVAEKRHSKIAGDLKILKNSKIIKVELLHPILNEARLILDDASLLSVQANQLLFDASSTPAQLSDATESVFIKIKQVYVKFLEMSALVKKMLGK